MKKYENRRHDGMSAFWRFVLRPDGLLAFVIVGAFALTVTLLLGAITSANAAVGNSYMRQSTPHEIADLIRKNLVTDPEGKALLSPEKCHQASEKSCASAWDYLKSFQFHDPKAGLTSVSQLPAYLDKLVKVQPKAGSSYFMDCLQSIGGDTFDVKINCLSRLFRDSEPAYADPVTGAIVMAFDCGNPVGQIDEPIVVTASSPCIKVYPNIPKGATKLHGEVLGPRDLVQSDKCPLPPDCNDHCDWRKVNGDLGVPDTKPLEEIGIHDPEQGMVILLPRDAKNGFTLVLCVDVSGSGGVVHRSVYKALAFHGSAPQDAIHLGAFKFPDGYVPE